jgi:Mg-chelatase subunit ChlD
MAMETMKKMFGEEKSRRQNGFCFAEQNKFSQGFLPQQKGFCEAMPLSEAKWHSCPHKPGVTAKGFAISIDALLATVLAIAVLSFAWFGLQEESVAIQPAELSLKQAVDGSFTVLENSGAMAKMLVDQESGNPAEDMQAAALELLPQNTGLNLKIMEYRPNQAIDACKDPGTRSFENCFEAQSAEPQEFGDSIPEGKEIMHGRKIVMARGLGATPDNSCSIIEMMSPKGEETQAAAFAGEEKSITTQAMVTNSAMQPLNNLECCEDPSAPTAAEKAVVTMKIRDTSRDPFAIILAIDKSNSMDAVDVTKCIVPSAQAPLNSALWGGLTPGLQQSVTCIDQGNCPTGQCKKARAVIDGGSCDAALDGTGEQCALEVTNCNRDIDGYPYDDKTGWERMAEFYVPQALIDTLDTVDETGGNDARDNYWDVLRIETRIGTYAGACPGRTIVRVAKDNGATINVDQCQAAANCYEAYGNYPTDPFISGKALEDAGPGKWGIYMWSDAPVNVNSAIAYLRRHYEIIPNSSGILLPMGEGEQCDYRPYIGLPGGPVQVGEEFTINDPMQGYSSTTEPFLVPGFEFQIYGLSMNAAWSGFVLPGQCGHPVITLERAPVGTENWVQHCLGLTSAGNPQNCNYEDDGTYCWSCDGTQYYQPGAYKFRLMAWSDHQENVTFGPGVYYEQSLAASLIPAPVLLSGIGKCNTNEVCGTTPTSCGPPVACPEGQTCLAGPACTWDAGCNPPIDNIAGELAIFDPSLSNAYKNKRLGYVEIADIEIEQTDEKSYEVLEALVSYNSFNGICIDSYYSSYPTMKVVSPAGIQYVPWGYTRFTGTSSGSGQVRAIGNPLLQGGNWKVLGWAEADRTPPINGTRFDLWAKVKRIDAAKNSAKSFAAQQSWKEDDLIGLVSYSDSATLSLWLWPAQDSGTIESAVNNIGASGSGTATADAISKSVEELLVPAGGSPANYETYKKYIILLTDGQANLCKGYVPCGAEAAGQSAIEEAEKARQNGVTVYAIGFADSSIIGSYEDILKQIAKDDGSTYCGEGDEFCGKYYFAEDEEALQQIYNEIASEIRERFGLMQIEIPMPDGMEPVNAASPGKFGTWMDNETGTGGTFTEEGSLAWDAGSRTLSLQSDEGESIHYSGNQWFAVQFEAMLPCSGSYCRLNYAVFPPEGTVITDYSDWTIRHWADESSVDNRYCDARSETCASPLQNKFLMLPFNYRDLKISFTSGTVELSGDVRLNLKIENTGYKDLDLTVPPSLLIDFESQETGQALQAICEAGYCTVKGLSNSTLDATVSATAGMELSDVLLCKTLPDSDECNLAGSEQDTGININDILFSGSGTIIAKMNPGNALPECSQNNESYIYCGEEEFRFFTIDYYAWVK